MHLSTSAKEGAVKEDSSWRTSATGNDKYQWRLLMAARRMGSTADILPAESGLPLGALGSLAA